MGMETHIGNGIADANFMSCPDPLPEGVSNGENGMTEPGILLEMLTSLDMDLAYSSEKLLNLDLCMTIFPLGENGLGDMSMENRDILELEIEKALMVDLLFGYLDSEVIELGHFLTVLRAKIVGAHKMVYSYRERTEIYNTLQGKLQGCEVSWKQLQEKLSEMKQQLTNLHRPNGTMFSLEDESFERSDLDLQIAVQRRLVLSMLEKSLASELDLEKKLLESREREEELKLKLLNSEKVIYEMEAYTEFALERLLEAEHSSETYSGIAKEMMSRIQILQFNLHCAVQREEKLKYELQTSSDRNANEREDLQEKVKQLQERLRSSESQLREARTSYEANKEQISILESALESLREHVFTVESRAHDAETKVAALTEENMDLREEVGFLKGGDTNEEKIGLLEERVRELDAQLQTSRAASEASIEQQNMLYSAIWDMETLIEELKSKNSKAESRAESAEEQCLVLAETNLELSKEIGFLKSENGKLEGSLREANREKVARVEEINNAANLVTEMVMQLADERERIQKQISSLARENKILLEELRKMRRSCSMAKKENKGDDVIESASIVCNGETTNVSAEASIKEDLEETPVTPTSANVSNQVNVTPESSLADEDEAVHGLSERSQVNEAEAAGFSTSGDAGAAAVDFQNKDNEGGGRSNLSMINKKGYIFTAVFVLVLSAVVMNISNWQHICSVMRRQFVGQQ